MPMTKTHADRRTVAPPAERTRFKPQVSLRFMIFLVTVAAGVLSLVLTSSPINVRLGAVCCIMAGAVYGASVLRDVRGIGPLRGRAFGGAWGGATAGLFVLFVLRVADPWRPYSFAYQMYWWFSSGAILGAGVGCLTAAVGQRGSAARRAPDATAELPWSSGNEVLPIRDRAASRCRRWLRHRFEETPAWYAAAFVHIALIWSVGAMTLVSSQLPIDGDRLQPLLIVVTQPLDGDRDAGNDRESSEQSVLLLRHSEGWRIRGSMMQDDRPQMWLADLEKGTAGGVEDFVAEQRQRQAGPQKQSPAPTLTAQWGTLRGRFVYDGPWPAPRPLTVTKDKDAFPETISILDESLVVNKENSGLANVIIWLRPPPDTEPPAVPPELAKGIADSQVMTIKDGRFQPHVVAISTSQKLVIQNQDSVLFAPLISFRANATDALLPSIPTGPEQTITVQRRERLPVRVECRIHPWMKAYLLVQDHPYFAVSDDSGEFEIRNLPCGEWTFQVWHETAGYLSTVTRNARTENWRYGRPVISIDAAEVDLGEILVPPSRFK